uniref:ribosomal protein L1 n=1 Tax=Madagascaria erythrocladioides TaxID=753684 RepID=UPI001BF100F8|nr:ribosomal protein L1 [Madagascaria erythrocladioides]QUE29002.1 ribosomal protein L1 [Madagascaria erythrocladioides]UNJ16554.1 ribosomal protein L1 [Madagascaria erythrocladioides]
MGKISRRLQLLNQTIDKTKSYSLLDAIDLLKNTSNANFAETAEAHICLGLEPKYADQQLRATVLLPKGTGKKTTVAVIARGEKVSEALSSGADVAGSEELIDRISEGYLDFDKLIATPDVMPLIAKLGRILGPRGLMPSPKAGTVTPNVIQAIQEFKAGKVEYRIDRNGIIHVPFGKTEFSKENLLLNLEAIEISINKNKPSGAKGKYWKSFYICSTMGPSIPIEISTYK